MKNLLCIFYLFLLVVFPSHAQDRKATTKDARSEQRVALVIGNSTYKDSPLLNLSIELLRLKQCRSGADCS